MDWELLKMSQTLISDFTATPQDKLGEGHLPKMSQPLISDVFATTQVKRVDGKLLKMSHTFIAYPLTVSKTN